MFKAQAKINNLKVDSFFIAYSFQKRVTITAKRLEKNIPVANKKNDIIENPEVQGFDAIMRHLLMNRLIPYRILR